MVAETSALMAVLRCDEPEEEVILADMMVTTTGKCWFLRSYSW